jgi:hypothetical protein
LSSSTGADDPHSDLRHAAAEHGQVPDFVPVEVPAGGGAFHAGWTWHGSNVNTSGSPRRSIVAHCMSADARFHPSITGYLYSRYKRFCDDTMDESFFPVTWRETVTGRRSSSRILTSASVGPATHRSLDVPANVIHG